MIVYVDFDGVIFDTVSIIIKEIKKNNIDLNKECNEFFEKLNWKNILNQAQEINFSILKINELKEKYNIKILTHVSSINEMIEKLEFIRNKKIDVDIIFVPKKIEKNFIVNANGNVLIDDSLKNIEKWNSNGGIGIQFGEKGILDLLDLENILGGNNNV